MNCLPPYGHQGSEGWGDFRKAVLELQDSKQLSLPGLREAGPEKRPWFDPPGDQTRPY